MRPELPYITKVGPQELVSQEIDTLKERVRQRFPGASYAIFYSPETKSLLAAPPYLVLSSQFSHALDYGSGIFEGGSAMLNEKTGIPHVILGEPRSDRMFNRSLPSRGYRSPIERATFDQAILDLIAINGMDLFKDPRGGDKPVRAYVRPTIHPASLAGFGVSLPPEYPIDAAIIAWAWPDYLRPETYTKGAVAAITGKQRLFEICGKHASNYGASAKDGQEVRRLGNDELIYLAPYIISNEGRTDWIDPTNEDLKLRLGALSDVPGEEVFAITKDQKKLVYPPMRVNRLGGTVLAYVVSYMAEKVGLEAEEKDITLVDLRRGEYAGVGMMGNAVKIAPIRQINLLCSDKIIDGITLFETGNIPEVMQVLIERWDKETRGLIDPSHPSLTTPVDMQRGKVIRESLDQTFAI